MSLWPRSLVGRNTLLIVALIALAELGSALLVRQLVIKPRIEQIADAVARNVAAVRAGLAAVPAAQRPAFVAAFAHRTGEGRTARQDDASEIGLAPPLSSLEASFVQSVSAALGGDDTEVVWRRETDRNLALRLRIDGQAYWLPLPGVLPAREFTGAWLAASVAAALLALAGALAIQRRIARPLRALVTATRALGSGARPTLLPEAGPAEIATLSHSFNQLVRDLEDAERERAVMLAGVSHDLRTPLTKLRLGIEILAGDSEPELGASMARSIAEMDAIIGQFLDFARVGESQATLADRGQPASLEVIAREVAASFAGPGLHAKAEIALELAPVPPVELRVPHVRRALVNLLENALRHGQPPIVLATGSDARSVWIEVRDSGAGIDPSDVDALREPFRRGDGARGGPPGSGLGLAIVDRVARSHGGVLDLGPALPHGLIARLTLPRPPAT